VVVDLQHGPFYLDAAVPMLQALSATPSMPMARCSGNNFFEINKLLDAGAYAIICPMIDSAADAASFVSACRYPPTGTRSYGPTRGFLYGGADYFDHANDTIMTWAMVETPQAMKELDAIAATPGLDGIFVGPADLSLALGSMPPPQHTKEPLASALKLIVERTHAAGKLVGCFSTTLDMAVDLKKMGFDFVSVAMDAALLRTAATERVNAVRKA
jgi:4-hydroxy-2-oxoheptanedioate aldolase